MKDRNERVAIFNETMKLCQEHPKLAEAVQQSIRGQKIFWQEDEVAYDSDDKKEAPKCFLSRKRTLEAARSYALQKNQKVCVLNFASSVTPGGGVVRGASAQEESMCRISTLYPAISDKTAAGGFYEKHWQMIHDGTMGRENRDDCIYTPGVVVMREDTLDCALMPEEDWYTVDVITCAAPDQREAGFGMQQQKSEQLMQLFERRFSKILSVAAHNQVDILILGAFGCGAFCNPPEIVVKAFNHIISDFYGCSVKEIEFAVFANYPTNGNYQAFKQIKDIVEVTESVGNDTETVGISGADMDKNLPVPKIDLEAVNKTLSFIYQHGFGLTDKEYGTPAVRDKLDYYGSRMFGGGSHGQCFYKLFCYLMRYIRPVARTMRYRYSAAALLLVTGYFSDGPHRENMTIEEFYRMLAYGFAHMNSISWNIWLNKEVDEKIFSEICDSYRRTGSIETTTLLKVLKALEWDADRIAMIEEDIRQNRLEW